MGSRQLAPGAGFVVFGEHAIGQSRRMLKENVDQDQLPGTQRASRNLSSLIL